jgi:hypothetical protein
MKIGRLMQRLDKAGSTIRARAERPFPAYDAFLRAVGAGHVYEHHLDALWDEGGALFRENLIRHARERREERDASNQHQEILAMHEIAENSYYAAIEIASLLPGEPIDPVVADCLNRGKDKDIDRLYFHYPNGYQPYVKRWVRAHFVARVIQRPDALELRKEIWGDTPPPVPHRSHELRPGPTRTLPQHHVRVAHSTSRPCSDQVMVQFQRDQL